MVYQLDLRQCIYQIVGQRRNYEIYQLFKDKNISKSTIKDYENDLPCVVKPKPAKPRVADNKKLRYVLQSIKNRVGASSHTTVLRIFIKNNAIHKNESKF
jgi:hypothetical protein